jgi:hypothetical protein
MFARPLKPDIIKEDCKTVFYLVRGIPYGLMGLSSSIIIIREAILGSKLFIGGYISVSSPH